jgi:hypothetical protein
MAKRKRALPMPPPPERRLTAAEAAPAVEKAADLAFPRVQGVRRDVRKDVFRSSVEASLATAFGHEAVPWAELAPEIDAAYDRRASSVPPKAELVIAPPTPGKPESLAPFDVFGPGEIRRLRYRVGMSGLGSHRAAFRAGLSGLGQAKGARVITPPSAAEPIEAPEPTEPVEAPEPAPFPGPPPAPIPLPGPLPMPAPVPGAAVAAVNVIVESDPSGRTVREVAYRVALDPGISSLAASGQAPTGSFRLELPTGRPYFIHVSALGHDATVAQVDLTSVAGGTPSAAAPAPISPFASPPPLTVSDPGLMFGLGITAEPATVGSRTGRRVISAGYMGGIGGHLTMGSLSSFRSLAQVPELTVRIRMRETVGPSVQVPPPFAYVPSAFAPPSFAPPLPAAFGPAELAPGIPAAPGAAYPPGYAPIQPIAAPAPGNVILPIIGEVPTWAAILGAGALAFGAYSLLKKDDAKEAR